MDARSFEAEARRGIDRAKQLSASDNPGERCNKGGEKATLTTHDNHFPVIREWEFGEGHAIVFTCIDSCLGAVQESGRNSVRGAHFSQYASGLAMDLKHFHETMVKAGFDPAKKIHFFGGSVREWQDGFGQNVWTAKPDSGGKAFSKPDWGNFPQECWVFEEDAGNLTYHHFR